MNGATLAIAGALSLACVTTPALAGAVPSRAEVEEALEYDLNTRCDGALESEDCSSHPSSVTVRQVRCSAESEETALCRYDRRIETIGSGPIRWRRAVTRFTHEAGGFWKLGFDFALKPEARDVEGALVTEAGRWCRNLIDACLDENGNSLFAEPDFRVSRLRCQPLVDQRSACSFDSTEIRGERVHPRRSCEGILATSQGTYGDQHWVLVHNPRRNASTLQCN